MAQMMANIPIGGTLIWRSVSVMIMANIEFIGWGVNSLPMICRYICRTYVTLLKVLCGSDGREVKMRNILFTSGPVKRKPCEGSKRAPTDHQHMAACCGPVEEQRTWWASLGVPSPPYQNHLFIGQCLNHQTQFRGTLSDSLSGVLTTNTLICSGVLTIDCG